MNGKLKRALVKLSIIQVASNQLRHRQGLKSLGRGYFEAHRFNPWHPLSYIVVCLIILGGILMFGFVGIFRESDGGNPFKWY